ncbi:MAG: AI-2E family transporter [Pseudomonadota bacterium]|nr:AI-2E family transporter [Pseudomonadota bacterium]
MQQDIAIIRKYLKHDLTEVLIRFSLILFLVVMSVKIFSPFMGLMVWALILAVTLYPLHQKIAKKNGGKQGRAATMLVLSGLLLVGVPTAFLGASTADFVHETHEAFESNSITIKAPADSVAEWPLVGEKVHATWTMAANDLPALIEKMQPQLGNVSKAALSFVAGAASGILKFLFALIISGIMMAYGKSGSEAMLKIIERLAGPEKGGQLHILSTATIRSVSMGVLGVAFIQALLLGVGFVLADIPAAGLLAIVVLVLGIAQIPATLVTIPVIAFLWWSGDSTLSNVFFTIFFVVGGLADNVLKPMFLGRGVEAPMPVILLGALGGMVTGGLVGLFVGGVMLALGYVIFMDWVASAEMEQSDQSPEDDAVPVSE